MKRILCLTLTLILVLSLCACGGANAKGLQVGYARQSIMPEEPVGLDGYSNTDSRISTGYLDILYATCIAFRYEDETVLLFTEDLLGKPKGLTQTVREQITEATGIAGDHIMFSGTHTHAAPSMYNSTVDHYKQTYFNACVEAAKAAIADLAPATLYGGKVQTENMTFVRHYLQEDGSITSFNNGTTDLKTVAGHAYDGDEEMVLIKMDRGEDKPAVMLMNFQAHPTSTSSSTSTVMSADYIGAARTAFEKETGMHFAFFQGAGGDLIFNSQIPALEHDMDYKAYGAELARLAVEAMPTMEKIEGEGIQTAQYTLVYPSNNYGLERLADAQKVETLRAAGNTDGAKALAQQLGFVSIAETRGIVKMSNLPENQEVELDAMYIAGLGIATAPVETFSPTGRYIKENSPFKYTVFMSCANGRHSYMPTKEAFDYKAYESFIAELGYGAAEKVAEQLVTMLNGFQ